MRTIRSSKSSEFDSREAALVLGVDVGDALAEERRLLLRDTAPARSSAFFALSISARHAPARELPLVVVEIVEDLFERAGADRLSSMTAKLGAMPMRVPSRRKMRTHIE